MALARVGWIIIAALIASLSAAKANAAPARLVALSDCPAANRTACLEMIMHWDYARTDRAPLVGKRAAGGNTVRVLTVRGALGKGGARFFQLAVTSSGEGRADDLGQVAYLGRSRQGRPIVLTDQGALSIETRGLHVGRADGVVIIDERAGKIAHSYLGGLDGGAYFVAGPDAVGAKGRSGLCALPPESRPGALKGAASCGDQRPSSDGLAFSERIAGAISPAPDANLALIRKLLPQTAEMSDADLRARVGRVGEHHLVVTPWGK